MKQIKDFRMLMLIMGLVASAHLNGQMPQYCFAHNELLKTYCSKLEQKAPLSPSLDHHNNVAGTVINTINATQHLDQLFTSINTDQKQAFALGCLNDDLCALFDPFNPDALIKPSSILGSIKLTELLSTTLPSSNDSKFLENRALINLFKEYSDLRTMVSAALFNLGQKTVKVFADKHTLNQWMELEQTQSSTFYTMISKAGYVTDAINGVLYGEHCGARLINWGTSWLPAMCNTAIPVWDPYYPLLFCAGGLLKVFSNSTRLAQSAHEMKAQSIKTIVDPFVQALQNISIALQAALRMTENPKLMSMADELILPETIAAATPENVAAIGEVLNTIGTIDACLALATAEVNEKISSVTVSNSTIATNMNKNSLEQNLTTLWQLSSHEQTNPWKWDGRTLSMPITMAQEHAQKQSKQFLVNLVLSQTIGFVISPTQKQQVTLPLIDISKIEVITMSRYANNEKIEFVASLSVTPMPGAGA